MCCVHVGCKELISGQGRRLFWASMSSSAMVSSPEELHQFVWTLFSLQEWPGEWALWWKAEQGRCAWYCSPRVHSNFLKVTQEFLSCTWSGFLQYYVIMWFYSLLCLHGELPMSQNLKQQITSMNNTMFPTSLLPHFVSPTLRAGLGTRASTPGSHGGWPGTAQVVQSSPALQMMQCLQVGFGAGKEETSAFRYCCCSVL